MSKTVQCDHCRDVALAEGGLTGWLHVERLDGGEAVFDYGATIIGSPADFCSTACLREAAFDEELRRATW